MNIRISVFEMQTPYVTILLVPTLPVTTLLVTILPCGQFTCDHITQWPYYLWLFYLVTKLLRPYYRRPNYRAPVHSPLHSNFFSEFFWFNVFTNFMLHFADLAMHKRPLRENDQSEEWILFRKIALTLWQFVDCLYWVCQVRSGIGV